MNKWQTLEHNGPIFPKEYEYVGFDKKLSSLAEEMLYHYAAKLETDYVHNKVFNKNFWNALKSELPKEYQSKTLEDFLPLCKEIFQHTQNKKEERKSKTKEQKLEEAKEKELMKEKYGWAILNGERQPIASPYIEGPGIFIARGEHPQLGSWKYRVRPEDVDINATNCGDIKPPKGHVWKSCKENKDSFFTCFYKVHLSSGRDINKFIQFSSTSIVKQNSDQKKFEKAITLIKSWEKVKKHIQKGVKSPDEKTKQTALVSYLIMNLGIRVGDEKGEDLADTVGASSLRKEHLTLKDNTLHLCFLGKDSVEYRSEIVLPDFLKKEMNVLLQKSKKEGMLFPKVSSIDIKKFLSEVVEGISAKVFRTAWGSSLLAESLQKATVSENLSTAEKIAIFNEANLSVAKKLNHQRNVGKNADAKTEELQQKLAEMKNEFAVIEKETDKQIKLLKLKIKEIDNKTFKASEKALLKKNTLDKIQKLEDRLEKKKQQIKAFELKVDLQSKTKNIALSTSKASYCDPRIGISFCKSFAIPLEKVYNKSMQAKFSWALSCKKEFYSNYKTIEVQQ